MTETNQTYEQLQIQVATFAELQLESRKDLNSAQRLNQYDQHAQLHFSTEWQLYREIAESEVDISGHNSNEYQTPQPFQPRDQDMNKLSSQYSSPLDRIIMGQPSIQMQGVHQHDQRQVQLLLNRQNNNNICIRTQLNEMVRLIEIAMHVEEEKQVRFRISQVKKQIRRVKLRSVSQRRLQRQAKQRQQMKGQQAIKGFAVSIARAKKQYEKVSTKALQLNNFVCVLTKEVNSEQVNSIKSKFQHQNFNSVCLGNQSKIRMTSVRTLSPISQIQQPLTLAPGDRNSSLNKNHRLLYRMRGQSNEQNSEILQQHKEIIEKIIQNYKQYVKKREVLLEGEKMSLKKQVQAIKLSILKAQNQNRKLLMLTHKSNNKANLTPTKIPEVLKTQARRHRQNSRHLLYRFMSHRNLLSGTKNHRRQKRSDNRYSQEKSPRSQLGIYVEEGPQLPSQSNAQISNSQYYEQPGSKRLMNYVESRKNNEIRSSYYAGNQIN